MISGGDAGDAPGEGGAGDAPGEGGASSSLGGGAAGSAAGIGHGGSGAPEGGVPGVGGAAGAGQGGTPVEPPPTLTLRAITISQTHELPLMLAGDKLPVSERPAPLVAGKRALVRAFVDLEPGFVARPLLGVLDVKTGQRTRTLVSERTLRESSLQDDLSSTFVFDVAAADLSATSSYRVRVLEADTSSLVQFPDDGGYEELQARVLPAFELVIVPFVANGFAPLFGETELDGLRRRLVALYPSTDVLISVAPSMTLPYVVNGEGDGWDDALDLIYEARKDAKPARNVFYYGALAPDASFDAYCTGACYLGYSRLADEADVGSRGSIGITLFQDGSGEEDAWDTVAHELGHALGRRHAPCDIPEPGDVDFDYPHTNASMGGTYGFDFDLMRLVKPKPFKDVMSYCAPVWISDYTYRALFERLDSIASESFRAVAWAPPEPFRLARIRRNGDSLWLREEQRNGTARLRRVDLLDSAGRRVGSLQAQVVGVDHGPGGYVWLPALALRQSGAASVDLRPLGGSVLSL